jgi:hypothetical protein
MTLRVHLFLTLKYIAKSYHPLGYCKLMLDLYLLPESEIEIKIEDGAFTNSPPEKFYRISIYQELYTFVSELLGDKSINFEKFQGRGFSYVDDCWLTVDESKGIQPRLSRSDGSSLSSSVQAELEQFVMLVDTCVNSELCMVGIAD